MPAKQTSAIIFTSLATIIVSLASVITIGHVSRQSDLIAQLVDQQSGKNSAEQVAQYPFQTVRQASVPANGWQYVEVPDGQKYSIYGLDMVPADGKTYGMAGGMAGFMYYYGYTPEQDGYWIPNSIEGDDAITNVDLLSSNSGWMTTNGTSGKIYRLSGQDWVQSYQSDDFWISDVSGVSNGEAWACGNAGSIFHYQNGSWTESMAPLPVNPTSGRPSNWLKAIDMYSPTFGAIAGQAYLMTYNGQNWKPQSLAKLLDPQDYQSLYYYCMMKDVDLVSETDGWAVGDCQEKDTAGEWVNFGSVYRWDGTAWTEFARLDSAELGDAGSGLNSVSMAGATRGWAVGGSCTIAEYNGTSWQMISECSIPADNPARKNRDNLQVVKAVNSEEAWVFGRMGIRLYYNANNLPLPTNIPTPTISPALACQYDINGNGTVGADDLLVILQNWNSSSLTKLLGVLRSMGTVCN